MNQQQFTQVEEQEQKNELQVQQQSDTFSDKQSEQQQEKQQQDAIYNEKQQEKYSSQQQSSNQQEQQIDTEQQTSEIECESKSVLSKINKQSSCTKIKKLVINKSKRRTRNESNQDRNYSCGCGKSYLSYPALYLHLRNKHEGRAPEGTLLPKQGGQNTRGRPRTISGENRDEKTNSVQNIDYNMQRLKVYLTSLDLNNSSIKIDNLEIQQSQQVSDYFQSCGLVNGHPVYILVTGLLNDNSSLKQIFSDNQYSQLKRTNINQSMAMFIYIIISQLNQSDFELVTKCLLIYQQYLAVEKKIDCLSFDLDPLLSCFNEYSLSHYAQQSLSDDLLFFEDKRVFSQSLYVIQFYINWLYLNNFTSQKIVVTS